MGAGARADSETDAVPHVTLHFRNAEIADVVAAVAEATGRSVVYDDRLRGRVTINVSEPVTVDEGLAILDGVLRMKGFAALPGPGGMLRIEPLDTAVSRAPLLAAPPRPGREATVTTLLRPASGDAASLAEVVRSFGLPVVVEPRGDVLIASGPEDGLRRLHELLSRLDGGEVEQLRPPPRVSQETQKWDDRRRSYGAARGRGARPARFAVRVALFAAREDAVARLERLRAAGLEGHVRARGTEASAVYELRLGPYDDLEAARRAAAQAEEVAGGRPVIAVLRARPSATSRSRSATPGP